MDARCILPSGGLGEFPGLCGLYSGPSPQESDGGPSQTGLARPPPWADCVLILRLDKHCPTTAPQPASGRITGNEQSLAQRAGYMVLSITSPHEDLGTRMFGLEPLPVVRNRPTPQYLLHHLPFYPVALRLG